MRYGLRELAGHREEGNDDADGESSDTGKTDVCTAEKDDKPADNSYNYIEQIAEVAENGHEHVAKVICLFTGGEQLVV